MHECVSIDERMIGTYRIAGNFGEVFNLANWRVLREIAKFKACQLSRYSDTYAVDIGRRQI